MRRRRLGQWARRFLTCAGLATAQCGFAGAWAPANPRLLTPWAAAVGPDHAHPEHPRPDFHRGPASWQSLNGLWEADLSPENLSAPPFAPAELPREILVPYPFEAALSGIRELPVHGFMWYRRNITLSRGYRSEEGRVLLKFEAVDWFTEVYVGGQRVGNHSGGYDGFSFDITDFLADGHGPTELVVGVFDPTENGSQPHGKQSAAAFHADHASSKYTSTSGIWATVWLEFVPDTYIHNLRIITTKANASIASVSVTAHVTGPSTFDLSKCCTSVTLLDGESVATHAKGSNVSGRGGPISEVEISLKFPKLWSARTPFLYNMTVWLLCNGAQVDVVNSYVGVRTVSLTRLQSVPTSGCAYSPANILPGFPKSMTSANACEKLCTSPMCAAWSFGAAGPAPPTVPKPGTPLIGYDDRGPDLPNMPIPLDMPFSINASTAKCEELCDQESQCMAWAVDLPGCSTSGHVTYNTSVCWLKSSRGRIIRQKCRICGTRKQEGPAILPLPTSPNLCTLHGMLPTGNVIRDNHSICGHWATKLVINEAPAPFLAGILSQGFWPDGEYATPDDQADIFELNSHKDMGFNYIRKHIKVGPHRWYYHADRLGMLVSQDMPETIHGAGTGPTFMQELGAMVSGRSNHPSIITWDLFNEARPTPQTVTNAVALVRKLDPTRPINAISGSTAEQLGLVLANSDIQDLHTDGHPTFQGPLNASYLVSNSEAHRCGCLPPRDHTWFSELDTPCYSVSKGVDCRAASETYLPWAREHVDDIKHFGLSATGYVQNRDMEGECNGLLTYDAVLKLDPAPIRAGNALLIAQHEATWARRV